MASAPRSPPPPPTPRLDGLVRPGVRLLVWGRCDMGQLGLQALEGKDVVGCAGGPFHSAFVTADGELFTAGCNDNGQLGRRTPGGGGGGGGAAAAGLYDARPGHVTALEAYGVRAGGCGASHTMVLTEQGSVVSWGGNEFGQTGCGAEGADQTHPRPVRGLGEQRIVRLAVGAHHALLLGASGSVWAVGQGSFGALGERLVCVVCLGLGPDERRPATAGDEGPCPAACAHPSPRRLAALPPLPVLAVKAAGDGSMVLLMEDPHPGRLPVPAGPRSGRRHGMYEMPYEIPDLMRLAAGAAAAGGADPRVVREVVAAVEDVLGSPGLASRLVAATCTQPPWAQQLLCEWLVSLPPELLGGRVVRPLQAYLAGRQAACLEAAEAAAAAAGMHRGGGPPAPAAAAAAARSELLTAAYVMAGLHAANERAGGKLPYTEFHNRQLSDAVNLREEYIIWRQARVAGGQVSRCPSGAPSGPPPGSPLASLCQLPFLLSPEAKSRILQGEAQILKDAEMSASAQEALMQGLHPASSLFLDVSVRRASILADAAAQLSGRPPHHLRRPLRVSFVSQGVAEEGVDQGGVSREFFQLLVAEIFQPQYGMFTYEEESRTFWFNPATSLLLAGDGDGDAGGGGGCQPDPAALSEFRLVGTVLGLALYNGVILDVHFPQAVYKKLLGEPVGLDDLAEAFPALGRSLKALLAMDPDLVEDTLCRNMEVSYDVYGDQRTVPLVPGGGSIPVTGANVATYVRRLVEWTLGESVSAQFAAFARGFQQVVGGLALSLFRHEELELLICGLPHLDFGALEVTSHFVGDWWLLLLHFLTLFWLVISLVVEDTKTDPLSGEWVTWFTHWSLVLLAAAGGLGAVLQGRHMWRKRRRAAGAGARRGARVTPESSLTAHGSGGSGVAAAHAYGDSGGGVGGLASKPAALDAEWDWLSVSYVLTMQTAVIAAFFLDVYYWLVLVLIQVLLTRLPIVSVHFQATLAYGTSYMLFLWIYGNAAGIWRYGLNWYKLFAVVMHGAVPVCLCVFMVIWWGIALLRERLGAALLLRRRRRARGAGGPGDDTTSAALSGPAAVADHPATSATGRPGAPPLDPGVRPLHG
ncbi:hypothetical protein GPECTOR_117g372 [Gonium pectorale]|uniref:HECT domain-containing protein n=1 Tax=Gonium pectorale TaxID=33097 RepID=A0A150FYZ9_GONPE|nr:hypothetical protein GPECTOR_117g372 [Gonium pectorale]|eukprot:KXZ42807.1 hypothetical protein GPECTOR_117g372 [Gonium pectorale]